MADEWNTEGEEEDGGGRKRRENLESYPDWKKERGAGES